MGKGNSHEKVIVFSAPSGSGKTTLVKHALSVFDQLEFSISCTTRAPRAGEVDAQDYYFLTVEEFQNAIAKEAFVEYEEVYTGTFYGTLKSEVERIWAQGKTVIFDVDVKGGIALKEFFGEKALSLFITVPSIEELEQRLINRKTEDEKTIAMRVEKAAYEMSFQPQFDQIVVNNKLDEAKTDLENRIKAFLA